MPNANQELHDMLLFASGACLVAAGIIALGWALVIIVRRWR